MLNGRILKIHTVLSLDGAYMTISSKVSGGKQIRLSPLFPLLLGKGENYVKKLEAFLKKRESNNKLLPNEEHDGISKEMNLQLFDRLVTKLNNWPFNMIPNNPIAHLTKDSARSLFESADTLAQIALLDSLIK